MALMAWTVCYLEKVSLCLPTVLWVRSVPQSCRWGLINAEPPRRRPVWVSDLSTIDQCQPSVSAGLTGGPPVGPAWFGLHSEEPVEMLHGVDPASDLRQSGCLSVELCSNCGPFAAQQLGRIQDCHLARVEGRRCHMFY